MTRVLITGVSTRAFAESAARAGFDVTAVDAFADLDQHPAVVALSMPRDFGRPFSALTAARACREIHCDAAAYVSTFENHSGAVAMLGEGRVLWGNPPAVLRRVRDPFDVAATLDRHAIATPQLRQRDVDAGGPGSASGSDPANRIDCSDWLLKRRQSGGGYYVRAWRTGSIVPRGWYLQQRIDGIPGSIVFAAARGHAVPLGISRQIVGDADFGATGFRYCGSMLAAPALLFDDGEALFARARAIASALAGEYDLVGLNGIDFVARSGIPLPIEVNPRWSASMELVERVLGWPLFGVHAAACMDGTLPRIDSVDAQLAGVVGKAVVYARTRFVAGDTNGWCDDPDVRDIPRFGERIDRGGPICSVFARAADVESCRVALAERARRIYDVVDAWRREAA